MTRNWIYTALFFSLFPACSDGGDSDDGSGGAGATSGGSSGNGASGSGGSTTTGGSSATGGSPTGGSGGPTGGSGTGDIGDPCATAADCVGFSNYEVECFADWPNGGHCTRACTFDTDCGSTGRCDDHEGGLRCFVDCANRFDPTMPLECPAGYSCSDGESCRPG